MKLLHRWLSTLCIFLLACAGTRYEKALPAVPRISEADSARKFSFTADGRELRLSAVVFDLPADYILGQASSGLDGVCTKAQASVNGGRWFGAELKYFTDVFADVMRQHGYPVDPGTTVFPGARPEELRVGARVFEAVCNFCTPQLGDRNARKIGNAYLKIAWSVYSNLERKVIFETTTEGTTYSKIETNLGLEGLLRVAFADAAQRLALSDGYRALLTQAATP
jgi:serine protease Do